VIACSNAVNIKLRQNCIIIIIIASLAMALLNQSSAAAYMIKANKMKPKTK